MLELLFCSTLTILPDFLYRRYGQGKRIGQEITLFSVWYELRWGITLCLLLTVSLITLVFYFHPASTNVTSFFRTVPVLPETGGRVIEIYVGVNEDVKAGQPLFRMDSSVQQTALETARLKVIEIDAQIAVAEADLATADAKIAEARGAYEQALDELATKEELRSRNPDVVPTREIDKLRNLVAARLGALDGHRGAEEIAGNLDHHSSSGAEGQRRRPSGRGAGRARQGGYLCWRRWNDAAVLAAGR